MLARTFMTAKQLGCSEIERQAAITVLDMLERGELKYVAVEIMRNVIRDGHLVEAMYVPPGDGLNMGLWSKSGSDCGVGCMGFWMERVKGRNLSERTMDRWDDLFTPSFCGPHPEYYTPERCARALHAKLTTGKADWN